MPTIKSRSSSPTRKTPPPARKAAPKAAAPRKTSAAAPKSSTFKTGGGAKKTLSAAAPRTSAPVQALRTSTLPGSGELLRSRLEATRRMMDTGTQIPKGPVDSRGAEFRTVPPGRQESVARSVQRKLDEKLEAYSPAVARELAPLVRDVGSPHFYKSMARFDPTNRAQWLEMVKVQKQFADAEPGYDAPTRAYSESMRLTLHSTAVLHRATSGGDQYQTFIRNHVTAFRENGGWFGNLRLGASGSGEVLANTPLQMGRELPTLLGASFDEDPHTQVAAEMVRQSRAEYVEPDP